MHLTETQKGEVAVLSKSLLSGLAPVVAVLSFSYLGPLASLAFSTLLATITLAVVVTIRNKWHELAERSAWKDIAMTALIIGVLFYSFYFVGLKQSNPGTVSLIALLEIFFSFLFFNIWHKEYFSPRHIIGAAAMLLGAAILLVPQAGWLNSGNLFVLVAVALAPFGNYFQRRARKKVSSETILFARNLLTFPCIFLLSWAFSEKLSLSGFQSSFWFLLFNGALIFGAEKILWIEGIHRISVTKAAALSKISPFLTLLFSFWILGQKPTPAQLLAIIPLFIGLLLLTYPNQIKSEYDV